MTQRIFDIENEKDMANLWEILPDEAYSIKKSMGCQTWRRKGEDTGYYFEFVNINWHDKTEITRPVDYESMIGCVCKFSTCPIRIRGYFIGILDKADNDVTHPFHMMDGGWFKYCEPVKKSELKFWGE